MRDGKGRKERSRAFLVICEAVFHGFINQYFFQKPRKAEDTKKLI